MNLKELSSQWQQKKLPIDLDVALLEQIENFDSSLQKKNLKLTYWFAGTIYVTGIIVFPFLQNSMTMLLLGAIWFLLGIQAMVFWLRQTNLNQAMADNPKKYIDRKLSKLRYNLLVTKLFMPIYMILLGLLSSLYLYNVLEGVANSIITYSIMGTCLFYLIVYYVVWKKQRSRDIELIIPQINKLNKIKAGYNNG